MKRPQGCSRGNTLVEFALVLPLLLIIIGGVLEFSLVYFVSHITQNAARDGARLAATLPNLEANDARVLALVKSKIPDSGLFSDFIGGITSTAPIGAGCAQVVTVTVSGDYNSVLALHLVGLDSISLERFATMHYEVCAGEGGL